MSSKRDAPYDAEAQTASKCYKSSTDDMHVYIFSKLVFEPAWLDLKDVGALLSVNSRISEAIQKSLAWETYLEKNAVGLAKPYGTITTNFWVYKLFGHGTKDLHLPSRIRGARFDRRNYYPHPSDSAETQGCVLAAPNHAVFCPNQGVVDLFRPMTQDFGPPLNIFIKREFPIVCQKCVVTCTTNKELLDHCMSWSHQIAHVPEHKRISEEYWDPRNQSVYHHLSAMEKVKACCVYKQKILGVLNDVRMSSGGVENMQHQMSWMLERAQSSRRNVPLDKITLENVTKACVRLVRKDFLQHGMSLRGYCRAVIVGGWEAFDLNHDHDSKNRVYKRVLKS